MIKGLVLFATLAVASAQFLVQQQGTLQDGHTHVGSHHVQTVRGFGGASSVTNYQKAVDGPFSSIRKYDSRVTNDHSRLGYYASAPAIHAPALHAAAPVYAASPVHAVHHSPVYASAPAVVKAAHPAYSFVNPNTYSLFYNSNGVSYHF